MLAGAGGFALRAWAEDFSAAPARVSAPWIRDAVVYEIFPRNFSSNGTFAAITAQLDNLKALGVDVLWLMPIHPTGRLKAKGTFGSPYAVRDYYGINPDYGTAADLHQLITTAHQRGLKVILDIVANHTAWDSVMMANTQFYKRDAAGRVQPPNPNWTDVAGLDYSNPDTCRYMLDMLRYWVREFDVDGFRCDVAGEVPTRFWEQARAALEPMKPGIFLLAEASKPELLVRAFDADYDWPMLNALNRVFMDGAPATDVRKSWEESRRTFPRGALHLRFTDNHDEARAISRYGWNGALAASVLVFTLDGLPLLYNGMEVGDTTESGDPALFEKLPIFWHPKQREGFRATYQQLSRLRKQSPAFGSDRVVWLTNSTPADVITFLRPSAGEEFLVAVNCSNRNVTPTIEGLDDGRGFQTVLSGRPGPDAAISLPRLSLGAFGYRIERRATSR